MSNKRFVSPNLAIHNESLILKVDDFDNPNAISLFSSVSVRYAPQNQAKISIDTVSHMVITLSSFFHTLNTNGKFFLFATQPTFCEATKINTYKKLWKSSGALEAISKIAFKTYSGVIWHANLVRYCGVAIVNEDTICQTLDYSRRVAGSFVFFSNEDFLEKDCIELYNAAFPNSEFTFEYGGVNWSRLVSRICNQNRILLRITGKYDDPDLQLDFIFNNRDLEPSIKNVIVGIVGA